MKKIVSILLVCCCMLLTSCTTESKNEKTNTYQEVESEKTEEEEQYPEVVDETGVSRQLKLGDVDAEDMGEEMQWTQFASDYSQVSDGHYYYMRSDGSGNYTVYRDKGEEVICFTIKGEGGYYIDYFVKYKEKFYAFIDGDDIEGEPEEMFHSLVSIDATTGEVVILKDLSVDTCGGILSQMLFYKDFVYYEDFSEYSSVLELAYNKGKLAGFSLDETKEKKQFSLSGRVETQSYNPLWRFAGGKLYYGLQDENNVTLFSYDLEKNVEKEVFSYERKKDMQETNPGVKIEMDEDYIYCQDYIIPRMGGKMERLLKDSDGCNFSSNSKYIFYVDRKKRVHRLSKKTHKDVLVCDDIKVDGVDCTEEGIYVKEHNKEVDALDEDSTYWYDNPCSNNLYYMDFDGKHREKIWKEIVDLAMED